MWICFLRSIPFDGDPIFLNVAILNLSTILKRVAASADEAELGALFLNDMEVNILRITLEELGHPQPTTHIYCNNTTEVGIVNYLINVKDLGPRIWDIFGFFVSRHKVFYTLATIQVRKTWATTSRRYTMGRTTNMCAHFIFIRNTHQYFNSGLQNQVPVEGELESVKAHMGIGLLYPRFHLEDGHWTRKPREPCIFYLLETRNAHHVEWRMIHVLHTNMERQTSHCSFLFLSYSTSYA